MNIYNTHRCTIDKLDAYEKTPKDKENKFDPSQKILKYTLHESPRGSALFPSFGMTFY